MSEEKNKRIYEIFGWCWHEPDERLRDWTKECKHCGTFFETNPNFYTSDSNQQAINFFKLWREVKEKEWFTKFLCSQNGTIGLLWIHSRFISCSALADAIIEYWKGRKVE